MPQREDRPLVPGPVGGSWWVRISTLAAILGLAVSAATAALASWIKLADKQHHLLVQLSIWVSVLAGVGFVAAACVKLAELRAAHVREHSQWRARVRELLRECPDGALPRLANLTDAALGATPTRYTTAGDAPYVHRPLADARLGELLAQAGPPFPFVVLVGDSKAGKSRTAAQAARSTWADVNPRMLLPHHGEALAKLMRLDPPLPLTPSTPVWLDELTPADLSHLSTDVLDAVAQRGCLVATMTEDRWNQIFNSRGEVAGTARAALLRATAVRLDFELTDSEAAEARRLYPNEKITASIAETLVGAQWLLDKYRAGRADQPAGCSLVQAAVDARRCGLPRPIRTEELLRLFPLYLRRIRVDLDPTTALFDQGLAWAKLPVASQVALVTTTPEGYQVFDYILAIDDGQEGQPPRPIIEQIWAELLSIVEPHDAFKIGMGAYLRGNRATAIRAMGKAINGEHTDEASKAAFSLGALLGEQGDAEGARTAYQLAIDSGHADAAPMASVNLGVLLREQGDAEGARTAYQLAIDSGHADAAPKAAGNLGRLLREWGDAEGARAAYQLAIDSGHTDEAPTAAFNLGELLMERGDAEGAWAAYQLAFDSGHTDYAPMASVNLGVLLRERGDAEGARTAYQLAVDSGHAEAAPKAAFNLGVLLREQGDSEGARAAFQLAIDSGHADMAPKAAVNLGLLLREQGDSEGAREAYQLAIDSGHADMAPKAAVGVGLLLGEHGDTEGARAAYQLAIDSGHTDYAPMASFNLGLLLAERGDAEGARTAYQLAIHSGHADAAPPAAFNLGLLLREQGDSEGARAAFQLAIDSGHADMAPKAAASLGFLTNPSNERVHQQPGPSSAIPMPTAIDADSNC